MSLMRFLRDKLAFLLLQLAVCAFTGVFLSAFALPPYAVFYVILIIAAASAAALIYEYIKKSGYYRNLILTFEQLDKKYLLAQLIAPAGFADSVIFCEIIKSSGKSMNDKIAEYNRLTAEYREFIEAWVHEIKTPIASALLTAQNNRGEAMARVEEDLASISSLVQKALYYARSNDVEKDYIIKETSLAKLVNSALARNARQLIQNKISVETPGTDMPIYTDEKWLDFILGQIIGNAVKYAAANGRRLIFSAEPLCRGAILSICDNGIGIPEKDLPRVFGKGFTGENGRLYAKSTGMGLYLCKKLCDRLGVAISMRSDGPGKGACVSLTFPASGFYIGAV